MSGLSPGKANLGLKSSNVNSPTKRGQRKEEGWKEVIRKSKKVAVPANAISRVIGRGGCNINAIREVSGAHIEVDKQKNTGGDRMITIKGSAEVTRQAHNLITALVKDPDKELDQILPKLKLKMPATTAAAVTTNTATFTATMWHNSMANNIPAVTSSIVTSNQVNVSTSAASANSKIAAVTTKTIATTKAAIVTTAATLAAMMPSQNGFANAVRQQVQQLPNVVMSRANAAAAAAAISTGVSNGAVQAAVPGGLPSSPKRLAAPGTAITAAATSVSPTKGAVRALFTDKQTGASQHQQNSAANPKSTVTYTQASMAKTKVVTSTMPTTFAAKVDNRTTTTATPGTPKMQPKLQGGGASQGSKTPTDRQPPMGGKSEPQPLPIKTTTPVSMHSQGHLHHHPGRGSNPGMSTGGPGLGISAAAEYSPFNNIFSQLQERVIGKKEDQMNFASVAAAGVVPPPQERQINSGPPQHDIHADPNLIAKAPGYKAPGQRTTSPQVNELEPSKAPGYKGGFSPGPASDPLNEPLKSPNQFPGLSNMGHHLGGHSHHHHHHAQQGPGGMGGSPGGAISMDTFRVPPPPFISGGADYPPDPSRFRLSAQMNASSPRGSASSSSSITGGGQSPKPLDILSQLGRDEYSMPNQPMTLPRIESTLNPNAPDFTSRSDFNPRDFPGVGVSGGSASRFLQAQQYAMLHQQQQGGSGHGRESGSSGGRNHPPPPGGPHGSALPPQQDMRVPPPTGAPPPPTATMLSQQNFNALLQTGAANLVLPPGSTNMPTVPEYTTSGGAGSSGGGSGFNPGSTAGSTGAGSFLNPTMMGATGTIPVATVGVVTPQQRQYQGASPMQHQHSASAPGSAHPTPSKADGSPGTTVASDGSPTSSSAPSPTDHSKLSGSTGSTAGGGGSGGPGTARGQVPGADDDKRFPQPIGAGRTNKKPAGSSSTSSASQNIFQLGDPAANAGLWAFAADLNADWISAVSSVMTTSVVTSAVMSGGAGSGGPGGSGGVGGVELDERPASHPAAISPHLLPTAFSPDPTLLDPSLDQLQTAALLVPNTPGMGGAAAVFANGGIPPAAAATAVLSIPPLYTAQPPVGDTGLPSMWGPTPGSGGGKLAPQVQDTVPVPGSTAEAKMLWNNWTAPSSM